MPAHMYANNVLYDIQFAQSKFFNALVSPRFLNTHAVYTRANIIKQYYRMYLIYTVINVRLHGIYVCHRVQ